MISITIISDAANTQAFLVRLEGGIRRPKALNDRLARALARRLQAHFKDREKEPNKLGGKKTGFWAGVRAGTVVGEVSDSGATVRVGVDTFFRIHLLGGTVKPVRGRFLTIPLVKEAHGLRAAEYERQSGRKLFRLPGSKVLLERTAAGTQSTMRRESPTLRTRAGYKVFNLGPGMRVRPVYALATEAKIKADPRALPPRADLAATLQEAANAWAARETNRKASSGK